MPGNADGPKASHIGRLYTQNPLRAGHQLGMTLRSGQDTINDYTRDGDFTPKGMFPGRVERKPKRRRR